MARYRIVKKGKSARKVEICKEKMEVTRSAAVAMGVCLLLAVVVWLYFVGIDTRRAEGMKNDPPTALAPGGESAQELEETRTEPAVGENITRLS